MVCVAKMTKTHHNTCTNGNTSTTICVWNNVTKAHTQKCDRNQPHGVQ